MNSNAILGALLLLASTAIIFGMATMSTQYMLVVGVLGALGMSAGALMLGTSGDGRAV